VPAGPTVPLVLPALLIGWGNCPLLARAVAPLLRCVPLLIRPREYGGGVELGWLLQLDVRAQGIAEADDV
jgi:hypothetical protein